MASNTSIHSIDHGPFAIGSQIQVNNHLVTIQTFIAEGGFAHVYTVLCGEKRLVLKRISCPDQSTLRELIQEAEIHVRLG
jgi:AP2-associated kinase